MTLNFKPALNSPNLLARPVFECLQNWKDRTSVSDILVAEIDPQFMGGAELCEQYDIPQSEGANCIIIEAVKGETKTMVACLVPVDCKKADFNGIVRKHLGARRVSVASLEKVLKETGMEYGSITVVGLPSSWKILIDSSVVSMGRIIIGSGLQKSKLSLPGKALLELPGAQVLEGLCMLRS